VVGEAAKGEKVCLVIPAATAGVRLTSHWFYYTVYCPSQKHDPTVSKGKDIIPKLWSIILSAGLQGIGLRRSALASTCKQRSVDRYDKAGEGKV
jgi:hypothetical protein